MSGFDLRQAQGADEYPTRGPHREESFHIEGCAVVDRASLDILEAVGEPFEGVPQQPKLGADEAIIASAVIGSPNCSHKIEFSFLNGNLVVSAGPSTIFTLTVMPVEANSIDGGVTLHQSIEPDTGRLAEVQSCLSHLNLQPPRAVFPCWLSLWLRLASAPLNSSSWGCCRMLPAILASRSPKAGLLVTGYALSVAFGSPFLAVATARMDRRKALLLLIGIFILGNLLCALAPNYALLMAARIVTALCHGAFFGLGAVVAATLVPEQEKAQSIAIMFDGLTLANVLGAPFCTALGQAVR